MFGWKSVCVCVWKGLHVNVHACVRAWVCVCVCVEGFVCKSVCVCTCVWNIWIDVKLLVLCSFSSEFLILVWFFNLIFSKGFQSEFQQGGSESHSIHCPMKTVVWDCDIGTDHPDVPANFQFPFCRQWQPAISQEPACRFSNSFQTKRLYCFRNLTELHQNKFILRART